MRNVARLNDKTFGTCCHPDHKGCVPMRGRVITGSSDTFCNNRSVARLNDIVVPDCGHDRAPIVTGSNTVFTNSRGTARINDNVQGKYYSAVIVTGSPNTFAG